MAKDPTLKKSLSKIPCATFLNSLAIFTLLGLKDTKFKLFHFLIQ